MGYRGEDLDLRTPQTWSATPADLASASDIAVSGQRAGFRNGPLWVDDNVLACSNHAFDVALAHRAGEVRIEHLLHALTRIDAAAEALEARGVRVASLRRETATIIASEIPVSLPNGKGMPRRSEEFADVLRAAASNAARRNAPASVEDLLYVLLDPRSSYPGLAALQRNVTRTQPRDVREVREVIEPLPPLTRYVAELPRYTAAPVVTERFARMPPLDTPRYVTEPQRVIYREYTGTPTDSIQNTRLDALEQSVRALGNDLTAERSTVANLLKDLSRETQAQRDDQGRLHSGLYDRIRGLEQTIVQQPQPDNTGGLIERLQAIENGLELRLQEMSQSWALLSTRLQDLEMAVRQTAADKTAPNPQFDRINQQFDRIKQSLDKPIERQAIDWQPITNRLDIIEEALLSSDPRSGNDVADRLKSLEGEIARALASNTASANRMESLISGFQSSGGATLDTGPLLGRITEFANTYQTAQTKNYEFIAKLADRMTGVEQAIAAEIETSAAKHQAYTQDLSEVHDALMKLNQNQHTLAGSIDQWRTDAAGDVASIANRLVSGGGTATGGKPDAKLEALGAQMDTISRLMVERYHRRNRFWYWLFGTDDWIGSSWPSQAAAMEAERQRIGVQRQG